MGLRPYNLDQNAMVVINYQEQLQPGTFEHVVHYLIEHKLDLSVFHLKYRNEDAGSLAYDPAILMVATKVSGIGRWERLRIGFFYSLVNGKEKL